jgi:hypothetical protein
MQVVASLLILVFLGIPQVARAQLYVEGRIGYSSANFSLDEPFNGVVDDNSVAYGVSLAPTPAGSCRSCPAPGTTSSRTSPSAS